VLFITYTSTPSNSDWVINGLIKQKVNKREGEGQRDFVRISTAGT